MSRAVIDSSALLAYFNMEPGSDFVAALLPNALICSVNACEVATKLFLKGASLAEVRHALANFGLQIVDFDDDLALDAGALILRTRPYGLSLGDRACLALAARLGIPALTADRAWKSVNVGVPIEFIGDYGRPAFSLSTSTLLI